MKIITLVILNVALAMGSALCPRVEEGDLVRFDGVLVNRAHKRSSGPFLVWELTFQLVDSDEKRTLYFVNFQYTPLYLGRTYRVEAIWQANTKHPQAYLVPVPCAVDTTLSPRDWTPAGDP